MMHGVCIRIPLLSGLEAEDHTMDLQHTRGMQEKYCDTVFFHLDDTSLIVHHLHCICVYVFVRVCETNQILQSSRHGVRS